MRTDFQASIFSREHQTPQASIKRRPLGCGTGSPNSLAVSIQRPMAALTLASASSWVGPCAAHPGNSGTSATYVWSSSLQKIMISYLIMPKRQAVLQNNSSHLPDLVRFCVATVTPKIDPLLDIGFAEEMMASADARFKSQGFQQSAQVIEPNASVGGSTQQPFEGLCRAHGAILSCRAWRMRRGNEDR